MEYVKKWKKNVPTETNTRRLFIRADKFSDLYRLHYKIHLTNDDIRAIKPNLLVLTI